MRLQIARRRDLITKKETSIMEYAKKNASEKSKNEEEKAHLEMLKRDQLTEEEELHDQQRRLKKREFDELSKKAKML